MMLERKDVARVQLRGIDYPGHRAVSDESMTAPIRRAQTMYLFLNRNCMVFDEAGEQIVAYQRAISCYRINKKLAMQATMEADEFWIAGWRDMRYSISRKEMQYLLGLRTRAMDLADMDAEYAALKAQI